MLLVLILRLLKFASAKDNMVLAKHSKKRDAVAKRRFTVLQKQIANSLTHQFPD